MAQIGQSHPTGLTNNLLKLFEPRPPLEFKPPPEKRKCPPLTGLNILYGFFSFNPVGRSFACLISYICILVHVGIAQFVSKFAEPGDTEYAPPVQKGETPVRNSLESLLLGHLYGLVAFHR